MMYRLAKNCWQVQLIIDWWDNESDRIRCLCEMRTLSLRFDFFWITVNNFQFLFCNRLSVVNQKSFNGVNSEKLEVDGDG